jgi:hypothetical protein
VAIYEYCLRLTFVRITHPLRQDLTVSDMVVFADLHPEVETGIHVRLSELIHSVTDEDVS